MHRFSLVCDARGIWTVTGATGSKPLRFRDLPAAVEFARNDACGSEADAVIGKFKALTPSQTQDILNFLRSL